MSEFKKFDSGKPMMSLVTPEFREGVAAVLTFGAQKYGAHNWRKGTNYSRLLNSAHRHLAAFERGEDVDTESGLSHLLHAATNLMFLYSFVLDKDIYTNLDDRYVRGKVNGE